LKGSGSVKIITVPDPGRPKITDPSFLFIFTIYLNEQLLIVGKPDRRLFPHPPFSKLENYDC
jgi:hypothetical protein